MEEQDQQIINEIDSKFNEIAQTFSTVNECLLNINEKFKQYETAYNDLVKSVEYIQSFDKVYYKPPGGDEYLTIKENMDLIYKRLGELENNV